MGKISADVIGANRLVRQMLELTHEMDHELDQTMSDLGADTEVIYAGHARKRTGRMARGIKSRRAGSLVLVEAHARNPKSGYDYVGVTRFGHRRNFIKPRWDRAKASVLSTGRSRRQRRGAALRLTIGGEVLYRRRVRGFRPAGDWADKAWPQIKRAGDLAMERLGLKLMTKF